MNSESEFKIGDRVVVNGYCSGEFFENMKGKIVAFYESPVCRHYLVDFNNDISFGHNGNGLVGGYFGGNCFYIEKENMSLLTDEDFEQQTIDIVNHPTHYTSHPSGVECITITRHMTFNIGNVFKYCWRSGLKDGNPSIQDLKKAAWYLEDEIKRLEGKND